MAIYSFIVDLPIQNGDFAVDFEIIIVVLVLVDFEIIIVRAGDEKP